MESIAKMYKNPLYGLKDTVKANYYLTKRFEYYEAKVAQNEVEAFSTLAGLYEYGNGVAKDMAKAKDLYLRGANLGSSHCHYCLAEILKREDNRRKPSNTIRQQPRWGMEMLCTVLRIVIRMHTVQRQMIICMFIG